ncbi:MAG: hypothetical protein EOM20_03390 [Spartobacteria bacterium]|nr:hypothetical protein [Spartobacteria bacterium]
MRVTKTILAVLLLLWGFHGTGALAQDDDLDLESLLQDLTEEPVQEQSAEATSTQPEPGEPASLDVPAPPVDEIVEMESVEIEMDDDFMVEEVDAFDVDVVADDDADMDMGDMLADDDDSMLDLDALEEAELEEATDEDVAMDDDMAFGEEVDRVDIDEEVVAEPVEEDAFEEVDVEEKAGPSDAEAKARAMAMQEEVRRQAAEVQGLKQLEAAYRSLNVRDYPQAKLDFEEALNLIPARAATRSDIDRAKWGLAEADYQLARELYKARGDMTEARSLVGQALKYVPDHGPSLSLLKKIEREAKIQESQIGIPVPVKERPIIIQRGKDIAQLLKEARQFYDIKDYNAAEALFEQVLLKDEYNVDAMRYLKKIEERKYKIATTERDANLAKAMARVRETWNPPIIEAVQLPDEVRYQGTVSTVTPSEQLRTKMDKIIIPAIEFRSANIQDVVNFLVEESVAGDPDGDGVNIILNLNIGSSEPAEAPASKLGFGGGFDDLGGWGDDDFGGGFDEPAQETFSAGGSSVPTITLNLRRISLHDALKIITEVAGLRYRIDGNVVIITPSDYVAGTVITRMYPVQPSFLDVVIQREEESQRDTGGFIGMDGGSVSMSRQDVKDFFEKAGVPFPRGTSITYNQGISQLIVANTAENLEVFERILALINIPPHQVEIEARFVELSQNNLEELGLEWILNDNWEIAQKKGSAPVGGQERVQVNKDSEGFTKGLRYFGFDRSIGAVNPVSAVTAGTANPMGNILTFASVLTNPEMSLVIHALNQSGGADLLSAPRVTTRSGVNAQIEIVREIIYPTEFEVTQPTIQSEGNMVTPPTVTPGGFETRETGVILNVTPTVGPDSYTIDLTMIPEVSELVDWIQYGSDFEMTRPGTLTGDNTQKWSYNIPQPIFSSRNVTTSLVIWDGQTVVMGGLMREQLVTMNDKVPILGDIPLLGHLFRSKGEYSQKMNLLIFVTARLVDPSGKPIHSVEFAGGAVDVQN